MWDKIVKNYKRNLIVVWCELNVFVKFYDFENIFNYCDYINIMNFLKLTCIFKKN